MHRCVRVLKILKITFRAIIVVVCLALLAYNAYVLIARYAMGDSMPSVFGYAGAAVVSGSMDDGDGDDIKVGDFVIVHSEESYDVGDVIMFESDGAFVTHRIIAVSSQGFTTKGDANNAPDFGTVKISAVKGRVVAVWSGAGNAVQFLRSPAGIAIIIVAGALLWFATGFISSFSEKRSQKKKYDKED